MSENRRDDLSVGELKRRARALALLQEGDFSLSQRLIERGDATNDELTENLLIHQVELEAQAAELSDSQVRLERALYRFRRLFKALPLPAVVTDAFGIVLEYNTEAENVLGIVAGRATNTVLFRCLADDTSRILLQRSITGAETDGHSHAQGLRVDGGNRTVLIVDAYTERLDDDDPRATPGQFVIVLVDQTDRIAQAGALRHANAELRVQQLENARLAAVARRTQAAVVIADAATHITWVNEAFTHLTEYSLDEVLGRRVDSVLSGPGTAPAPLAFLQERMARGEGVSQLEVRLFRRSGTPFWSLVDMQVERGLDGAVQQYLIVHVDITARKRAEASARENEERQRAIFDAEPNCVDVLYADGTVQTMNAAGLNMLRARARDVYSQPIARWIAPEHLALFEDRHRRILHGESVVSRYDLVATDGTRIPVESHAVPLWLNGSVGGVVSVAHDITETLRSAALARARDAAEAANRAKSEFLSSMSHELRTPLNAVLGYAQLMEADLDAPARVQRDRLSHIQVAGWHLLALINDVLDLSRIESDRIDLRMDNLPLDALLAPCVSLASNACEQRGLRLDVETLPDDLYVRVDPLRFKQIVTNLLSNAAKYNSPRGTVGLRAFRDGAHVRVEVSDTGRGLSPAQLGQLYEPFNRLGAEGSNIEGAGIGLVITKRLVEVMGGSIEVESTVGEGSRFTVVFPGVESAAVDGR